MTPESFIAKWRGTELSERAAAQEHFIDLCRLLDEPTPMEADPEGRSYAFEKGAIKTAGGRGFADVWKRGHFALEYKRRGRDLRAAFEQLQRYALGLESPPLLAVCDLETFTIRTAWTNAVSEIHEIRLEDLRDPRQLRKLKWMLSDPERLRPGLTREALTAEAAAEFVELARRLRARGHDAYAVAHFINRIVFCLFADKAALLPAGLLRKLLDNSFRRPERFARMAGQLFAAMRDGGELGVETIEWFNGGLFDTDTAIELHRPDIELLRQASERDWAEVEPSIFGTLFERGLDPAKEQQIGAHYTDAAKIGLILEPVLARPLRDEWATARTRIAALLAEREPLLGADAAAAAAAIEARSGARGVLPKAERAALARGAEQRRAKAASLRAEAEAMLEAHLARLRALRVLDPACGSGNFLYVALMTVKDAERRAVIEAEALGLPAQPVTIGPEVVLGIELNDFAAELARVSVWIGALQWTLRNGYAVADNPILKPLQNIACRDALLAADGTPAAWPAAEVIVGNPPFVGGNTMIRVVGEDYANRLRTAYAGQVPGSADLVCYWFAKGWRQLLDGQASRVGFVSTQAIRSGASSAVLAPIVQDGVIFEAWANEAWTVEGANVRVSLICFARTPPGPSRLDGLPVGRISQSLTGDGSDLSAAATLAQNTDVCFQGFIAVGDFDIPGDVARSWLDQPANPNGLPNARVVKPWINARETMQRSIDRWIVDFGTTMTEAEAARFIRPFTHVALNVAPQRAKVRRETHRDHWWRFGEPRPGLRRALAGLGRFIATPKVSRHRVFVWLPTTVMASQQFYVFARDDDTFFGVLHSRFHEAWSLRRASWHGVGNDPSYTPTATFMTFPFPEGLTPDLPAASYAANPQAQAIAAAAQALVAFRDAWLNPPDLVELVPEVVPGFPDRIISRNPKAAAVLRTRTLTNLYNTRGTPEGTALDRLHATLDAAVAAAYGWPADLPEAETLARLLLLNQARAAPPAAARPEPPPDPPSPGPPPPTRARRAPRTAPATPPSPG